VTNVTYEDRTDATTPTGETTEWAAEHANEVKDAINSKADQTSLDELQVAVDAISDDLSEVLTEAVTDIIETGGEALDEFGSALAEAQSHADSASKLMMFESYADLTPEERAEVVGLFLAGPEFNGPVNPGEFAYVDVGGMLTGWWFNHAVEGLFNCTEADFPSEDTRFSTFVTDGDGTTHLFQTAAELGITGGGGFTGASPAEQIAGTDTIKGSTCDSVAALWEAGSDVAADTTTTLGFGGYFTITGNTAITAFAFTNDKAGRAAKLRFTGTPAITHHGTSMILPGGANITMVAGATATIVSLGSGNFVMVDYVPGAVTGTGSRVLATSPTFVTPALGTPSSGVITNCTGGPTLTSATLVTPALGTPTSGVLTNCTGGPTLTNATLVTPILGTPQSGTLTNCTGLPNAGLVTLPLTIGTTEIYVDATEMTAAITSGAEPVFVEMATNDQMVQGFAFDTTADEFAHFKVVFPKKWNNSTVLARPIWYHTSSNATATVTWCFEAVATSNDDTMDVAWGTAQRVVDDGATGLDNYTGANSSALTIGGTPASGDLIFFRVSRDVDGNGTAGNDDLAQDAILLGVVLTITTSAATDA
jgi:hypothetical protein